MKNNWIIGLVLMLALAGTVMADEGNSTNSTDSVNIQNQALEVRYEHLECKLDFTNGQIDLFDEYVDADLSYLKDSEESLNDHMETLEEYMEENNTTAFNEYMEETFRPEFNNVTRELNSIKSEFKKYNLSNSTKTELMDEFKDLREEYADCVNNKEMKMGELMQKHMENWNKHYMNSINKMSRNGMNTTEMDAIIANITARNARLQELIDSGNITKLKEFMEQYREETMYFATKMEIEKLKNYKSALNEDSQRYDKEDKIRNIDRQLEDAEKYAYRHQDDDDRDNDDDNDRDEDDDRDEEKDYKGAWDNITGANRDMKELSKEILRERVREYAPTDSENGMNRGVKV